MTGTENQRDKLSKRRGFTLIELLVVIVIIALLAALSTGAFMAARKSVRQGLIATEIAQIAMALDDYKTKYGEYPPDLSDENAVMRHLRKRWPRMTVSDYEDFCQMVQDTCGWNFRAANGVFVSPVVFWLGGFPNSSGELVGFALNPESPLEITPGNEDTTPREKPLYQFDTSRCVLNYGSAANCPAYLINDSPLVYFRYEPSGGYMDGLSFKFINLTSTVPGETNLAAPYAKSINTSVTPNTTDWYESKRFQLIHPGLDGMFGVAPVDNSKPRIPANGTNMSGYDRDNITNFLKSGTLVSEANQ